MEDIEAECKKGRLLVVIGDKVLDLTHFKYHSGGFDTLEQFKGTDCSLVFNRVHKMTHNISKFVVSQVVPKPEQPQTMKQEIMEDSDILRSETSTESTRCVVYNDTEKQFGSLDSAHFDTTQQPDIMRELALFTKFIRSDQYPCVAGRIAFVKKSFCFGLYSRMGDHQSAFNVWTDLVRFIRYQNAQWRNGNIFTTFVAIFQGTEVNDEDEFHDLLWKHLQIMHNIDHEKKSTWPSHIPQNVLDPHFSFVIAGRPFFLVGLHPNSSRKGRTYHEHAIVFNSKYQFDKLREYGIMQDIFAITRGRDLKFNGSINPNLIPLDDYSAALQYSGKELTTTSKLNFETNTK